MTADVPLEEEDDDEPLDVEEPLDGDEDESSAEESSEDESSEDSSSVSQPSSSLLALVLVSSVVLDVPVAVTDAVVWVVVVVPMDPSYAMTPNATAKVASAPATTRRRSRRMRAARARSFSRASCLGDLGGSVLGAFSVMASTVGAAAESALGAPWELPEHRSR